MTSQSSESCPQTTVAGHRRPETGHVKWFYCLSNATHGTDN